MNGEEQTEISENHRSETDFSIGADDQRDCLVKPTVVTLAMQHRARVTIQLCVVILRTITAR